MATPDYNNLIETLKSIQVNIPQVSESANRDGMTQAAEVINHFEISDSDKDSILKTLLRAANPSNWYYESNGIDQTIKLIEALKANVTPSTTISNNGATQALKLNRGQIEDNTQNLKVFNRRNLRNLVSDGRIFSVEFIKRSTGELRTMTARVGVTKHLKGGLKSYNPAHHNLLTVFDMNAKGYRSIPVESIQRLSIGGQFFDFAGA